MPEDPKMDISKSLYADEYFDMPRAKLLNMARKKKFFHDMGFHDYRTRSHVYPDSYPPNYHLFPTFSYLQELKLGEAQCIDIGTFDGMTAFMLSASGASHVNATCQHNLERFRIARALGEYENIAYHPNTDLIAARNKFEAQSHDVVVMSAMLHHLVSPLEGLLDARRLLKDGGYLILETITVEDNDAGLSLNTIRKDPVYGAPTIWLPSPETAEGMLNLACFEIVSSTRLLGGAAARETNYERMTYLARASSPKALQATKKTSEIHSAVQMLGPLSLVDLDACTSSSAVQFTGKSGARTLNIWSHQPSAPLQPQWEAPDHSRNTRFSVGSVDDFRSLASRHGDGAFEWEDIYLLGARCHGETMPDGMRWGLKQLGNLHILDYVKKWGCRDILEVGAGFNLYFDRHLPKWANVDVLDDEGFYDKAILDLAVNARKRGRTIYGLLGKAKDKLTPFFL